VVEGNVVEGKVALLAGGRWQASPEVVTLQEVPFHVQLLEALE